MRFVIDGSTTDDPKTSVYDSDPRIGNFPPFRVYDVVTGAHSAEFYGSRIEALIGMLRKQADEYVACVGKANSALSDLNATLLLLNSIQQSPENKACE